MDLLTADDGGLGPGDEPESHVPDPDGGFCLVCRQRVHHASLECWEHDAHQ